MAEVRVPLRELREQAGRTQAQLAERIGVAAQVSKIENWRPGERRSAPSAATSKPLAVRMEVDYVMGDQRVRVA